MPRKPRKMSIRTAGLKPYEVAFLLDDDAYCRPHIPRDKASLKFLRQGSSGLLFGDRGADDLWQEYGEEATALFIEAHPGRRPCGWWLYDAPEPRRPDESEIAYLQRHGLLTPAEVRWLKANPQEC